MILIPYNENAYSEILMCSLLFCADIVFLFFFV